MLASTPSPSGTTSASARAKVPRVTDYVRRALVASATPPAQAAAAQLADLGDWVEPEEADVVIALGGDGFMLQTLHAMLERRKPAVPVFGMNLGTVGFLMNEWRHHGLEDRLSRAKPFKVTPLSMTATGSRCFARRVRPPSSR
jgi:NAD+ kinase